MKVVYFGSDVFLSCFEYFVEKHQVLALYTYHNDEDYFTEYAIVKRAEELGIPVHYEAISPEEIRRYFTEEGCELFFIAEYDRILTLPEELPAFRGINTHSSLLPQGRSYYPIEGAMERELSCTGVTMHKVAQRLVIFLSLLKASSAFFMFNMLFKKNIKARKKDSCFLHKTNKAARINLCQQIFMKNLLKKRGKL